MNHRGKEGTMERLVAPAVLVLLTLAVYANTLSNGFLMDDTVQIVYNDWIKDIRHLSSIFTTHSFGYKLGAQHGASYRPLVISAFMAEYALFGLKPWGWHLVNIILHAVNTVMVFVVARRLLAGQGGQGDEGAPAASPLTGILPAFVAAAVFSVHPTKSEAVAWVGCMPEIIFTFLCLLAFYLYMMEGEAGGGERGWRMYLSVALFFMALFAKETALSLLPLLFVYDLIKKGRPGFGDIKRYIPYAAAVALYFAMRMYALGGVVPREPMYAFLDGFQVLINAVVLFARYIKELLLGAGGPPMQLLDPVSSVFDPAALASIAFAAALSAAVFVLRRRISPHYALALAFIVLPLLPALYIPGLHRHSFTNRYLYFPSVGFALFAGLVFRGVASYGVGKESRAPVWAALAVFSMVTLFYSFAALKRNPLWKDDLTFWSRLAQTPDDYYARVIAGRLLEGKKSYDRAEHNFREAIAIMGTLPYTDPSVMAEARTYLANIYYSSGRRDEALVEYRELYNLYPEHPVANYQLGVMYQEKGDCDRAVFYYTRAARFFTESEDIKDAYINIGNCYLKEGLTEKAAASYTEALAVSPGDPVALNNLRIIGRDTAGAPKR